MNEPRNDSSEEGKCDKSVLERYKNDDEFPEQFIENFSDFLLNNLTEILNNSKTDEELKVKIDDFCIFNDFEILERLSSQISFTDSFTEFIFQHSNTKYLLFSFVKSIILLYRSKNPFSKWFSSIQKLNLTEEFIESFLSSFSQVFKSEKFLFDQFLGLFEQFLDFGEKIKSKRIINLAIDILLKAPSTFTLTNRLFNKIIDYFEVLDCSNTELTKIFNIDTSEGLFIMKNSLLLPIFISLHSGKDITELSKLFFDLCEFSFSNCVVCHNGFVDFIFLEYLENISCNNGNFMYMGRKLCFVAENPVELLLPLIFTIMRTKTSAVIFEKILHLLTPTNPSYFNSKLECISNTLIDTINDRNSLIQPSFDIFTSTSIGNIRGFTSLVLNYDFSFSFWIILDISVFSNCSSPFNLLEIVGSPNPLILSLLNNKFLIKYKTDDFFITDDIPNKKWFMFTISFERKKDGCYVTTFINKDKQKNTIIPNFAFKNDSSIKIDFCSNEKDFSQIENSIGKFGPYAFFNYALTNKEIQNTNIKEDPSLLNPNKTIFSSNTLLLQKSNKAFEFIPGANRRNSSSFIEVVTHDYDVNYITHLTSSFPAKESKASQAFVKIIFSLLCTNVSVQQKFYTLPIIAQNIAKSCPTFEVYNFIYHSLESIKFKPLRDEIIDKVILNPSIWGQGAGDNLRKVINRWRTKVIKNLNKEITERWGMKRFISMFWLFFFDNEKKEPMKSEKDTETQVNLIGDCIERRPLYSIVDNFSEEELKECRESYFEFLFDYGMENTTFDELYECLCFIVFNTNLEFFKYMLRLVVDLYQIISGDPSFSISICMQMCFNTASVDKCITALFALEKVSNDYLNLLLSAATIQIISCSDTNAILSILIDNLSEHFKLYPICCELALNCKKNLVEKLCEELCRQLPKASGLKLTPTYQLWPLILAISLNDRQLVRKVVLIISEFIRNKSEDVYLQEVKSTLDMINFLSQINRRNAMFVKAYYISVVSVRNGDPDFISSFIELLLEYLLFEDAVIYNTRCINLMFSISPFVIPKEMLPPIVLSAQDLKKLKLVRANHRLSILVDDDGTLEYKSDLRRYLNIIIKNNVQSKFTNILKYFLGENKDEIRESVFNEIEILEKTLEPFNNETIYTQLNSFMSKCEKLVLCSIVQIEKHSARTAKSFISNEVDFFYPRDQKYYETIEKLNKGLTKNRNSDFFLKEKHLFKRDNSSCFCFCPFKLKVDSFGIPVKERIYKKIKTNLRGKKVKIVSTQTDFSVEEEEEAPLEENCFNCRLLRIKKDVKAKLFISDSSLKIETKTKEIIIHLYEIVYIFKRKILQFDTGIELFLSTGANYLIDFAPINNNEIISRLSKLNMKCIHIIQEDDELALLKTTKIKKEWESRRMSNFRYLMMLNILSGRSFNTISIYPITPWITRSISSNIKENMRNLEHPMKYDVIKLAQTDEIDTLYHHGPMSSLILYYFLFRLEPFTTNHIEMQSGSFDDINRLFVSLGHAIKTICSKSGDVRELPPEFYFEPETFVNVNNVDFGILNGTRINDLNLPDWADNTFDFVYKHRKLLETEEVSNGLGKWIDLIWGINQSGQNGYDHGLYFYPFLLTDYWKEEENAQGPDKQIKTAMELFGVMPPVLFDDNHSQKRERNISAYYTKITDFDAKERLEFMCPSDNNESFYVYKNGNVAFHSLLNETNLCSITIKDSNSFFSIKNSLVIFDHKEHNAMIITKDDIRNIKLYDADELYGDGSYLVAIRNRCVIIVYNINACPIEHGRIISNENTIDCITISEMFRMIAYTTKDNILHLHSLKSLKKEAAYELNEQTKKLMITPAWGFICVLSVENKFTLFDANGMKLKELPFDFEVVQWASFSSSDDFDFILIVDSNGRVLVFEAYEPQNIKLMGYVKSEPVNICFALDLYSAAVTTKDGRITIFPFLNIFK